MSPGLKRRVGLVFLLHVAILLAGSAAAALSDADRQMLQAAIDKGIFDPTGKPFIHFKLPVRDVWTNAREIDAAGWLIPGEKGNPNWIMTDQGEAVPAVQKTEPADFAADCNALLNPPPTTTQAAKPIQNKIIARMRQVGQGGPRADREPSLLLAVWLHRLGNDGLAAAMLTAARRGGQLDPASLRTPKLMGPWHDFAWAVHAYMVRADSESLFYAQRLNDRYINPPASQPFSEEAEVAEETKGKFEQGKQLLAELKRRQAEGTFDKPAATQPADFKDRPVEQRIAWLIKQLEEVDSRQNGQPGGVGLSSDWRVKALIDIGEPAVPALIDCIEKDDRLTRSVQFWRDFSESRTILQVREPALAAVMSILRVTVFAPVATGQNFTAEGADAQKKVAGQLRQYWKTYGSLPFDQRMMKILTDPKATIEAQREAASNLAELGEDRVINTTVFTSRRSGRDTSKPNPAVARFKNPTAAEAILAAMDRELAALDAKPRDNMYDYYQRQIENSYAGMLIDLGDKTIAPEAHRRSDAAAILRTRRLMALICKELGDAEPMSRFVRDFAAGTLKLPEGKLPQTNDDDQPDYVELRDTVGMLASFGSADADAALTAMADPRHPFYAQALAGIMTANSWGWEDRAWFDHPYCLRMLLIKLSDESETGTTYTIEGPSCVERKANLTSSEPIPAVLADPANRLDRAAGRACDLAAMKISDLVIGLPAYHPLLKDADARRKAMAEFLQAHLNHLRRADQKECETLGISPWAPAAYMLNVQRVNGGATKQDVATGRAIFALDGKGTPVKVELPASATLRRDVPPAGAEPTEADVQAGRASGWVEEDEDGHRINKRQWNTPRVLIVQAEREPDGKLRYGVIAAHAMFAIDGDEVTDIKPLNRPATQPAQ